MDYLQATPLPFFNHTNAGLVAGTTNTLTSVATTLCSIRGKFATTLAPLTNSATTPTLDAVTNAAFVAMVSTPAGGSQACFFVLGQNLAGVIKAVQGPIAPTELGLTTTPGNFIQSPQFPPIPDDFCPLAYLVVRTSPTGNAFTFGTTSWAASGITTTVFRNISMVPDRPQIS